MRPPQEGSQGAADWLRISQQSCRARYWYVLDTCTCLTSGQGPQPCRAIMPGLSSLFVPPSRLPLVADMLSRMHVHKSLRMLDRSCMPCRRSNRR